MLKKYYIYYIITLLSVSMLFSGCVDDFDTPSQPCTDSINLNVSVPVSLNTRASEDVLNEFIVKSLHLYFFPKTGHDDAVSEYVFDYQLGEEFSYSRSLFIPLPADAQKPGGIFGTTDDECYVYAVANVSESLLTGKTMEALKSTFISSNFANTVVQDYFAMDGTSVLSLDRTNRIVTGDIHLQRAASKLTLSVDLPASITVTETINNPMTGVITEEDVTYISRPNDIRVLFTNGVSDSELNCEPRPADENFLYSNELGSASGSAFKYDDSQPKYKYVQDVPFYSYPNSWDPYSPTGNSYLTLIVPWTYTDANGINITKFTYYKLAVQQGRNFIARNTHYDMRVSVSRLGGTTIEEPVDMLLDWDYAIQWNTQTLPTDIKEVSYLLLNNNDFDTALDAYYFEMNNETEISIPFSSSHPVIIDSVTLTWRDFQNNANREITLKPTGNTNNTYRYDTLSGYESHKTTYYAGIEVDQVNSTLNLERELFHILYSDSKAQINTGETAINTFTFTIKLRHDVDDYSPNDPSQNATVVIRQIPAIYITSQKTEKSVYRFVNTYNANVAYNNRNPKGFLSNSTITNTTQLKYHLGSLNNTESNTKNFNTYIINITKFDSNSDYVIADPRSRSIDNLSVTSTNTINPADWSVEYNGRQLQYYYTADDDSQKSRFIAPRIRIASQWGITVDITREGALRRCASYQENGRPAGRWRVPTFAEIEFISTLSNKGLIPYLFGDATNSGNSYADYWCATGAIAVDNSATNPRVFVPTDNATKRSVRCVYDEWYWGNDTLVEADKNKFRWGDRARSVSGN